jgi:hypothetical protein
MLLNKRSFHKSFLWRQEYELVLAHIDVGGRRLPPKAHAVDIRAARTESAVQVDDPPSQRGKADLDRSPSLKAPSAFFSTIARPPFIGLHHGARLRILRNAVYTILSSEVASPTQPRLDQRCGYHARNNTTAPRRPLLAWRKPSIRLACPTVRLGFEEEP